tara:strand:+ start:1099 stop:1758 length:660 start_codon:yes stop_codon:yes gene_type:complete
MHAWIKSQNTTPKELTKGLLIVNNVISFETEMKLLKFLRNSDIQWQNIVGKWGTLEQRRFGWGDSPVDRRNENEIPELLQEVGNQLLMVFRSVHPSLPCFSSCTANRYPVGQGLGAHKDGPVWLPFVIGLTIGSSRIMEFTTTEGEKIQLHTKPCSAYMFYDIMYTEWYHASLKGTKNEGKYHQENTVFSLTYRTVNTNFKGSYTHEEEQFKYFSSESK